MSLHIPLAELSIFSARLLVSVFLVSIRRINMLYTNKLLSTIIFTLAIMLCGDVWAQINISRGPYLQVGTPESIVVRWRTENPSDSRVQYGTDPQNLSHTVDVNGNTREHEVQLTGLSPQTRYFYAIGNSIDGTITTTDYYFVTTPPVGTRKKTRVWILGDSGTGNQDARNVRDAYYNYTGNVHTDLWVMVGDNAYNDGKDSEYQDNLFEIYPTMLSKSVLWPAFGNHDGHSANSQNESGPFYEIFTLPRNGEAGGMPSGTEAYYSFDFANIHFICLNSHDINRDTNGDMLQWLTQDLSQNTQDWTIAYWHHPPYTKGSHDSDSESRLIEMRENALPILEGFGVDLVIGGHSHSYERSYLLDGHYGDSGTLTSAMILDDGDGYLDGDGAYEKPTVGMGPHEGAVYVVAGSSGKTSGGALNHPAMHVSLKKLGSVVMDIDSTQLDLTFLDDHGNVLDYFTMIKGSGVVGITTRDGQIPQNVTLYPNYPNPFNPSTTIRFDISAMANGFTAVRLDIVDIGGRVVKALVDEPLSAGSYAVEWNGTNQNGQAVPSGVYFYRLINDGIVHTRKLTLVR
jgi:hypothetical protein